VANLLVSSSSGVNLLAIVIMVMTTKAKKKVWKGEKYYSEIAEAIPPITQPIPKESNLNA